MHTKKDFHPHTYDIVLFNKLTCRLSTIHKNTSTHTHPRRCCKIPPALVILIWIFSIQLSLMEITSIQLSFVTLMDLYQWFSIGWSLQMGNWGLKRCPDLPNRKNGNGPRAHHFWISMACSVIVLFFFHSHSSALGIQFPRRSLFSFPSLLFFPSNAQLHTGLHMQLVKHGRRFANK